MAVLILLVLQLFNFQNIYASTSTAIPNLLLNCYKTNQTENFPRPPLTVNLLVELLRKTELSQGDSINLRMLTTSILHAIRLDGIQRSPIATEVENATPYRATGRQFFKYRLMVDYLIPGESSLFPVDALSTPELCILHQLVSNTVDSRERGDEKTTCVQTKLDYFKYKSGGVSICPVEQGIMMTSWGIVSAGHLIASLAAATETTSETVGTLSRTIKGTQRAATFGGSEELVDSTWVSSVAGDLGEVVVYQVSTEPEIGNVGFWNDSIYPRARYVTGNNWDLTEGEIFGGIDGIIMASQVRRWLGILSRTRVSQLIDMYYSSRGVAYDPIYKACNRFSNFRQLLNTTDLVAQVRGTARLLQDISNSPELIFDEGLEKYSQIAVEKYLSVAERKSLFYESCDEEIRPQNLEILVILGRDFDSFGTQRFLSDLIERLDISHYGNRIGLINGQTGEFLTNITGEIINLYNDLQNPNQPYPSRLSLSSGFITANRWYMERTDAICSNASVGPRRPFGQVVLVMARSDRSGDADVSRASTALRSIKRFYPETRIVYVSTNHDFGDLRYENDLVVEDVADIGKVLADVPARIVDFYCEQSETVLEDYVTPNVTKLYEVHETYLQRADVRVKFRGNDYADLRICAWGSSKGMKMCKDVSGNAEIEFWARDLCQRGGCSVVFSVEASNSRWKCSEADCRYPDQARLSIRTFWTRSGSMAREWSVFSGLVLLLTRLV